MRDTKPWMNLPKRWMNLQLFTDGDGGDNGSGGNGEGDGEGKQNEPMGFEEFLKDPKNQAEFDRRVSKALETQKAKLEEGYKTGLAKAKSEAEELAKMNAEQKQQYELDKLMKENADLKKAQAMVELRKSASEILKEQKIDATSDILDLVVSDSAETTKANIDKLVSIIDAQVKAAEVKRATGKTPRNYSGDGGEPLTKDKIMEIKDPVKRQKAISENMHLFGGKA